MKKILLIAVLLGAMLSVTVYFVCIAAPSVFFGKGLKGSGNIVTRTIEAPAFDRIDAARAVKVVITDKTSGNETSFIRNVIRGSSFVLADWAKRSGTGIKIIQQKMAISHLFIHSVIILLY